MYINVTKYSAMLEADTKRFLNSIKNIAMRNQKV